VLSKEIEQKDFFVESPNQEKEEVVVEEVAVEELKPIKRGKRKRKKKTD